ncbi:ABC transporter substrate-binding protein [Aquibacillus koreensis]|uniref:ABC transporter substrate-binding protein n=1 Tax=Aquibacillus koreensis TaxID=279446 RepID=A0A9X4AIY7_9BACI|nr:ABC transporter substrate-binding protein [Aquibacillus koreensis]MCT2537112.1 ABC transporter substrate-binding protein [Aquibacillus koreensis]MDC3419905.1 ABC transporter substrate-binding protein [Aquibacillus koreensis]
MNKFKLLLSMLMVLLFVLGGCSSASGKQEDDLKKITIAEPLHLIGYLPLYLAINEGYFEEEGLDVEAVTSTGGAHVTTVVSGEAWGNIGGPESNQMANEDSPDPILSVVNVVNRANVYIMADTEQKLEDDSPEALKAFFEGKTIAAGRYGGSPNLLTRYLLMDLGLDPEKDVTLEEPADGSAVVSLVENGKADMAVGAEPQINGGIEKGVWGEPFYKFPTLGDYPYSVISVRQSSIDDDPETVQGFVNAIIKGLEAVNEDKELAMKVLKEEFPTSSDEDLQAALDRAYADQLWSLDGFISEEGLAKTMDVVNKTGVYTDGYEYDGLVDMQFVEGAGE